MGPGAAAAYRALLGLSVLLSAARPDPQPDYCSQQGVRCTVRNSDCFDFSWLHRYQWTPNAPSSMAAAAGIGVNSGGRTVPLLQINWTVSMDSSILNLQGVELSVFQAGSQRCVQFQFSDQFPSQHNADGQPWQFHYNLFEVSPGHQYHVTVQHLPKLAGVNSKSMEVSVPGCADEQMMQTDACCDLGLCWFPNISMASSGRNVTVEFNPRHGADRYGVEVKVSALRIQEFRYISVRQRSLAERMRVTFPNIGHFEDCLYNISVWPAMASCSNDCIRQYYAPACATEAPPPPEPPRRWYLWFAAALLTMAMSAGFAICCKGRLCRSEVNKPRISSEAEAIPPPTKKKVWLVYSADHRYYIDAVIGLADFLQVAWGLDVLLDQHHVHKIGTIGAMAWLGQQKSEIERTNGTILILCSRGAQEKWKAMQNGQQQRVTLRADREHPLGDLFTPALTIILPDFQKSLSYDRYVVAYFEDISTLADIPSPLEICPKYSLTERLQDLFFRIQRREQHQPKVQLTVCQEDQPSYLHLVRAMEKCRNWQEKHVDWFENECSPYPAEEADDVQMWEEDVDYPCTKKVHPIIIIPETDVSLVEPLLKSPDPTIVLDPVIRDGSPCSRLEPSVREPVTMVTVTQPLLQDEISPKICIQEPCLAEEHLSLGEFIDPLLQEDFYTQSEQDIQSWEELIEAQRRLFYGNVPGSLGSSSGIGFMNVPVHDLTSNVISEPQEMEERPQEYLPQVKFEMPEEHQPQVTDLGYNTMSSGQPDLKTIQREAVKIFLQNGNMMPINRV